MKVACIQSNYIPWKGYFDMINAVDLFIFYDDVQYTRRDWRNRNRIKTSDGVKWLTIPCRSTRDQLICEVDLSEFKWQKKHWRTIEHNYSRTPYFSTYKPIFESIYLEKKWTNLSELNQYLIKTIARDILMITTRFEDSRNFTLNGKKEDRVLDLLTQCGATAYLSGPSAQDYILEEHFQAKQIDLQWMDYTDYPRYRQLYPPFCHQVSIIDLIFNKGPQSPAYMKTFNQHPKTTLNVG
ncbi:WbqC family protein [Membranicola marinus]|uniref:WbqC family protein n=1 Tax=Membranihabitans marinus TaxID=1227546 RepID=A0A953LBN8_9BACT|nr:WbqC family protein [Membranihabitans marinus]MBY5956849.1 WbqC family protein [Membranihabitans marinus]